MICYKSLFILSKPLQHFDCMTFSFVRNINLFENKLIHILSKNAKILTETVLGYLQHALQIEETLCVYEKLNKNNEYSVHSDIVQRFVV